MFLSQVATRRPFASGFAYPAPVPDVPALVAAYWRRHALAGGDRQQRLQAQELFWAWEAVSAAMEGENPLPLLDALLAAPDADACHLGAGPLEDLLVSDPARWGSAVEERCRRSATWRDAVACVWLNDAEAAALEVLRPYLKAAT